MDASVGAGYERSMNSIFRAHSEISADRAIARLSANPRRRVGEIGGKRFRVRFDGRGIPYHGRKRTHMLVAMIAGWALAIGVSAYSFLTSTPEHNTVASVCDASGRSGPAAAAGGQTPHRLTNFNLNVFNSTNRDSLAAQTAAQLQLRGFVIDMVSNDPLKSALTIPAQVRGAKTEMSELRAVAEEVPGAQILTDSRKDPSVDLILGSGFTSLAKVSAVC